MKAKITALRGDITRMECDAIVNPANSSGYMGGGVAWAIKKAGGDVIEAEAVSKAPIPLGTAAESSAGRLPARYVIHAPTMKEPAERVPAKNAGIAVYAALECARRMGVKSIAFPGMGTGVGGVSKPDAAREMFSAARRFISKEGEISISEIIFVAFDEELFGEFEKWTKQ